MSTVSTPARGRRARPAGPPTIRHREDAPAVQRLSTAALAEKASGVAKKPLAPGPTAVLELTARKPYDAARGNVDVYMPGRWDTTSNLIFMDSIVQVGSSPGEWEGSVAYVEFKPPAAGTYMIVGHFTGYQTTMHLNGPWGENTAYTAETTDSGAVVALWTGSGQFEFTMLCKSPNNEYGLGYVESIQAFELT